MKLKTDIKIFDIAKECWLFIEQNKKEFGIEKLKLLPPNISISNINPPPACEADTHNAMDRYFTMASFELTIDDDGYLYSHEVKIYPKFIRKYIETVFKNRISLAELKKFVSYVIFHEYFHYIYFTKKYYKLQKNRKNNQAGLIALVNEFKDASMPLISTTEDEINENEMYANFNGLRAYIQKFLDAKDFDDCSDFDKYLYYYTQSLMVSGENVCTPLVSWVYSLIC